MAISVIMMNQPNKTCCHQTSISAAVFEDDTLSTTMNADTIRSIQVSIQNMLIMNCVRQKYTVSRIYVDCISKPKKMFNSDKIKKKSAYLFHGLKYRSYKFLRRVSIIKYSVQENIVYLFSSSINQGVMEPLERTASTHAHQTAKTGGVTPTQDTV